MPYTDQEWNQPLPPSIANASNDTTPVPSLKRHAACDECRKRKLKCSGESTGCSRCIKQSLACHYSIQKQMGRPPKKRMREDDDGDPLRVSGNDRWADFDNTNQFTPFHVGTDPTTTTSEAFGLFPQVYCAPVRRQEANLLSADDDHNHSWQPDHLGMNLNPIPATSSPWPDFSSVSAATSNPFTMPASLQDMQSLPMTPSSNTDSTDSSNTQCTCLSYLYLCLSHLSSLAPFPISQHTICSLFIAAKTARDVIRCEACPKNFATGMQNVMFTGTLLNVVADAWLRVSKADAVELGKQAAPPSYVTFMVQNSPNPVESWAKWLRGTVRSAVIGGSTEQAGRVQCSDSPNLLSLIKEMEARQRKWHSGKDSHPLHRSPASDQSDSDSCSPSQEADERDLLCLRVVGSAREVIAKFKFEPSEYPDGVVS